MKDQDEFWQELLKQAKAQSAQESEERPSRIFSSRAALHRFRWYNRARLERLRRVLGKKSRFFDVLPLLVHQPVQGGPASDHLARGGFGIFNFEPPPEMRPAAESLFPRYSWRPGALVGRPVVRSLLAMGSVGTVAQSDVSDLDIWVIYDDQLCQTPQEKRLFERLAEIERWAAVNGLEVHFFPMSIEKVRRGDFGKTGSEQAGSALRDLLKEEFYRTHLLLQGQVPRWWLEPPRIAEAGEKSDLDGLSEEDFIDLGTPRPIGLEETLGATLWQMVKALTKPFKSFLKLALVERSLRWPEAPLICELLKERLVFGNGEDPLNTDPYFLLADCLVSEFTSRGRPQTAEMLERCFFLQLASSGVPQELEAERKRLLSRLAEQWRWSAAQQARMENLEKWPVVDIVELGRQIFEYMNDLLGELGQVAGRGGELAIGERDLKLLKRKLATARGQMPHQVPLLPVAFFPGSLEQPWLKLRRAPGGWEVEISAWEKESQTLSETFPRPELAGAFAVVNGFYGPATAVSVAEAEGQINSFRMRQHCQRLHRVFGALRPEKIPLENFDGPMYPVRLLVEVAAREKPQASASGVKYISDIWDVLDYGDDRQCLVREITLWTATNWGTLLARHFSQAGLVPVVLLECLQQLEKNHQLSIEVAPALDSADNSAAAKRMETLLRAMADCLRQGSDEYESCYFLTAVGGESWMISSGPAATALLGPFMGPDLSDMFARADPGHRLVVDPASLRWSALRWATERHRPEKEEVFIFPEETPSCVVFSTGGEIYLDFQPVHRALVALYQVQGQAAIRSCAVRAENGRYVECALPQVQPPPPHLEVEDAGHGEALAFRAGGEKIPGSLKQALIKLLSQLRPGEEKDLQVAFYPPGGQFSKNLVERLILRKKIIEKSARLIKVLTEIG
jgi:adenylate cyclase